MDNYQEHQPREENNPTDWVNILDNDQNLVDRKGILGLPEPLYFDGIGHVSVEFPPEEGLAGDSEDNMVWIVNDQNIPLAINANEMASRNFRPIRIELLPEGNIKMALARIKYKNGIPFTTILQPLKNPEVLSDCYWGLDGKDSEGRDVVVHPDNDFVRNISISLKPLH